MNQHTPTRCHELEHFLIPLSDGRKLSARAWLPETALEHRAPAILEYLPYRKRDGTALRDESTYPIFASNGYAGVRVDISGTGESDGDFDDEYSPRELADGVEVIAWIAKQDWCDGNIGMMGISWGGFNSLQIAALNPPALKAVVAIGTTVDRYNDDIHYKNGCLLYSNAWWSAVMLCYASRPPDPALVGECWRDMWLHRLQTQPFPLETWLSHQRRDDYWRHGSVCENYAAITTPALVISGWADGYINAPPAAAQNFAGPTKAINGPWIHQYPHFAYPHPRMDFLNEALRWWDHWLKGRDNGADALPAYRASICEGVHPSLPRTHEPGRWVAEECWPCEDISTVGFFPANTLDLADRPGATTNLTICSPLDTGTAAGEFFPLKPDEELAGDQTGDNAGSLVFQTAVLDQPVQILGQPTMTLRVSIDQPVGHLAVRLLDIHPDGTSFRVSWGVINLTHRTSDANPKPVESGKFMDIALSLDQCGYRFPCGHRIGLAISTAYWPMVMPGPYRVSACIETGQYTRLDLPVRCGNDSYDMPEPDNPNPLPEYIQHRPAEYRRWVTHGCDNNATQLQVIDDTGEEEIPDHGMRIRHRHEDCWSIIPDDPLSASSRTLYCCWMSRDDWSIRTETETAMSCDVANFYISAKISAFEGDTVVHAREWERIIPRDLL